MLAKTLLLAGLASAANFQVKVGQGGYVYEPSTITAQVGDTVQFLFSGSTHDVVQSTVGSPCTPNGGFSISPQSSTEVFTVNITSTDPMYFYCSVATHCNLGMVGIINPGTGNTQSDFAAAAKTATIKTPGNSVSGGVLSNSATTSAASSGTSTMAYGSSSSATGASGSSTTSSKAGGVATVIPAALAVVAGAVAALF